jgi:hypothetical protein
MGLGRHWFSVADFIWDYFAPSLMDYLFDGTSTLHGNNVEER